MNNIKVVLSGMVQKVLFLEHGSNPVDTRPVLTKHQSISTTPGTHHMNRGNSIPTIVAST
jgi:hypothetical protein